MIRQTGVIIFALLAGWPWHHAKPKHDETVVILGDGMGQELADDLAELAVIKEDYPWMRPWAEPTLAVINRLLAGDDKNTDDDLEQLRHDMDVLKRMKQYDTI